MDIDVTQLIEGVTYRKWISNQIDLRYKEYTQSSKLTVYCTTWNVNGKDLCVQDLMPLLMPPEDNPKLPDMYIIGLQEMVDLNVVNVLVTGGASLEKASVWALMLKNTLHRMTNMKDKQGMFIFVLCYCSVT